MDSYLLLNLIGHTGAVLLVDHVRATTDCSTSAGNIAEQETALATTDF
jgi:hypothetical protein